LVDTIPAGITPGTVGRGDSIHASILALGNLSRSVVPEDISRLQSAINDYSNALTYAVADVIIESGLVYRCSNAILVPETFNIANWDTVISALTPWNENVDAAQFTLSNIPAIAMAFNGTVDLEMYKNTNPGSTGLISKIDFDQRKTSGSKATFGSIRMLTNDAVAGTVNAEMQFQARVNDSLTVFMAINETDTESIRCFKPVNIHQTNISFDDVITPPGSNSKVIYTTSNAMVFNVNSSRGFEWSINDIDWMTIDPTAGIEISTGASQKIGFFGVTPVGPQSPGATAAEIITALEALGLFI